MNIPSRQFKIGKSKIGHDEPTYFIADIAANHDGDLSRAKELIYMVAEAGGNAAKFQHFTADSIVSDKGFKDLGSQQSHQSNWKKSVFDVYKDASINQDWTPILRETCEDAGIDFFTSPYSIALVNKVDPYVEAYKVGSGDITWLEIIREMAKKNKPILIASGASSCDEAARAVSVALEENSNVCLMQCNTNYTASLENFKYIQLNVLKTYRAMFPDLILGLSDHTPSHATVLGAITLGARVIEKHFTDDNDRSGPDHKFSMNPQSWREMIDRSRELEAALGTGIKKIENNERETVILQRRCIRAKSDLIIGKRIEIQDLEVLRPCPPDGLMPSEIDKILGCEVVTPVSKGSHLTWTNLKD